MAIWRGWFDGEMSLADDAYYYFQIARHVAQGAGPTFDGMAPTNGFHPLYLLVLAALYRLWPSAPWAPIHAALSLLVLCDVASAWLLYRIARRVGDASAATIVVLVWSTQTVAIAASQRGMESALSTALLLASALVYLRWSARPEATRTAAALGLFLGLAVLARTENALFVLALGVHAVLSRRRASLRLLGAAAVPLVLLLGPWLLWEWRTFGTIEQSSGAATRLFRIYGHLEPGGHALWHPATLLHVGREALVGLHRCALGQEFEPLGPMGRAYLVANAILLGAIAMGCVAALGRRGRRAVLAPLTPLLLYSMFHLAYYYAVAHTYRPWYPLSIVAVAVLAGAVLVTGLSPRRRVFRRLGQGTVVAVVVMQLIAVGTFASRAARFPTTRTAEHRIDWLERECGARARVGLMNAGKIGYLAGFRSQLRIVNLDGVVNNKLLAAYHDGRFADYYCANLDCALELPAAGAFLDAKLRAAYEAFWERSVERLPTQPVPIFRFRCDAASPSN